MLGLRSIAADVVTYVVEAALALGQVREKLVRLLELAKTGTKAADPAAQAFSSGHAAGLEDAIKLLDKVLLAEARARMKAAARGKPRS